MTAITKDHVEWTVVDRMRQMLAAPPSESFGVTETYALFTATLCWVMQHIRIPSGGAVSPKDQAARVIFDKLKCTSIIDEPWRVVSTERILHIGENRILVPAAKHFEGHDAARFLKNLRDATAHGDARNVVPFNDGGLLVGFSFSCYQKDHETSKREWRGRITLLQADMQRIGVLLAGIYCDAIKGSEPHKSNSHFLGDAASISEKAA